MIALAPHVSAFFQERLMLERQASANTCDSYAYAFKLLLNYASKRLKVVPSRLALEQIDARLVTGFLNDLETSRANAASSRNVRLAAIKSFMHFLEYRVPSALEQIQGVLAIPMKKTETRLVRHLTTEEIQALLDAPQPIDWAGIRDRAMLHLCFAAGLRVSELTGLRIYLGETHAHSNEALPIIGVKTHISPRTSSQLRLDRPRSHQGFAESLAMARSRQYADNRDVHSR